MTLILSDMLHSARSNLDFLVPVLSTLAWSLGTVIGAHLRKKHKERPKG